MSFCCLSTILLLFIHDLIFLSPLSYCALSKIFLFFIHDLLILHQWSYSSAPMIIMFYNQDLFVVHPRSYCSVFTIILIYIHNPLARILLILRFYCFVHKPSDQSPPEWQWIFHTFPLVQRWKLYNWICDHFSNSEKRTKPNGRVYRYPFQKARPSWFREETETMTHNIMNTNSRFVRTQ